MDIIGENAPYSFSFELIRHEKRVQQFKIKITKLEAILLGKERIDVTIMRSDLKDENENALMEKTKSGTMPRKLFISEGKLVNFS